MEMNGLLRRKMVVWNYSRLHTPEVGATTESNGSVATLSLYSSDLIDIRWRGDEALFVCIFYLRDHIFVICLKKRKNN